MNPTSFAFTRTFFFCILSSSHKKQGVSPRTAAVPGKAAGRAQRSRITKECCTMKGGLAELLNFKQKNRDMNEFVKVPVGEKLSYCFGDPALTLMYTMTSTLLIYFYTNVVGISAGAVGMIMLISRVFDGFSDVAMGTI